MSYWAIISLQVNPNQCELFQTLDFHHFDIENCQFPGININTSCMYYVSNAPINLNYCKNFKDVYHFEIENCQYSRTSIYFLYFSDAPTSIQFSPASTYFQPGDVIACSAESHPIPAYFWIDLDSLNVTYGSQLVILESMVGDVTHRYNCTALQNITSRSVQWVTSKTLEFTVSGMHHTCIQYLGSRCLCLLFLVVADMAVFVVVVILIGCRCSMLVVLVVVV